MLSKTSIASTSAADAEQAASNPTPSNTMVLEFMDFYFHQKTFKSDQQAEAVNAVLLHPYDVFVSMPDLSGRSMCYQLPAMIKSPKVTVVFCSLLQRIKQHVRSLTRLKIYAQTLNPTVDKYRRLSIMRDVRDRTTRNAILYVTPDEAEKQDFLEFVQHLGESDRLAYMVLDEVHCESQWLYSPRKEYEPLGTLRKSYPNITWVVITAEAGKEIVDLIKNTLNLKTDSTGTLRRIAALHERPHVYYDITRDEFIWQSYENITGFIEKAMTAKDFITVPGIKPSGIIYCKTRNAIDVLCASIKPSNAVVSAYHPGLTEKQQTSVRNAFMKGNVQILVVTGNYGMSINKMNVRFILHWGLPSSMLSYYKETCVAGRDELPVRCRIFYIDSSLEYFNNTREQSMKSMIKNPGNAEKYQSNLASYLVFIQSHYVKEYCLTNKCRNNFLSNYFGEIGGRCNNRCDICMEEWRQFYIGRDLIKGITSKIGLTNFMRITIEKYDSQGYDQITTGDTMYLMKVCDEMIKSTRISMHHNVLKMFNHWRSQLTLSDDSPQIDLSAVLSDDMITDQVSVQSDQVSEQMDQVSEQMDQVSDQMDQVSDQMDQVSNQMDQVSDEPSMSFD